MISRSKHIKWRKILFIGIASLIVLIIITCLIVDQFVQFRKNDNEVMRSFRSKQIQATVHYYTSGNRKLRYISAGNDSLPTLFFIHGSPGSLSFYESAFTNTALLQKFKMYSVDRPGYGYSGFGDPEPSIQQQAAMLYPIITELHKVQRPLIIVAYSYGSPIACRLLMDHPNVADGLILLAPSLEPGKEKYFWFTPLIEKPFIRWLVPRIYRSANTEKFHHKEELTRMLPLWNRIQVPVLYVQGEYDQWADTSNAGFAQKKLTNVPWLHIQWLKNRDHFFAWNEKDLINQAIFTMHKHIIIK
jgi:pimeloyl-ACP methyl ester carboxylesterase